MDKNIKTLNIIYAITDTLIAALSISCFAYMALHFERWWILLFSILPLVLYSQHTLVIESNIRRSGGGETDGRE